MKSKGFEKRTETFNIRNMRIFLIRHGQPEQHSGKVFLGQVDVPLSETGRLEAAGAADKLLAYGACPKRIYTSDLSRAKETADIIAERLGGLPVAPDKLLREMAMGTWDGELIEDIKAKFPEEYAKRGDDLRNYRIPGGENFYDLKGRVTREFYRIFTEDFLYSDSCKGKYSALADSGDRDLIGNRGGNGNQNGNFDGPGDLVIVAHLGVLNVLTEELAAGANAGLSWQHFATGSVVKIEPPDWLWAGQDAE